MAEETVQLQKYEKYFDAYAVEDIDDIRIICGTAAANLSKDLKIKVDYKMVGTLFSVIHSTFISVLQEIRDNKTDSVEINVANRFSIGFSTKDDQDDEKQGNFMIHMRHIGANKKITEYEEGAAKTKERAVQWNIANILKNPEIIDKISIKAVEKLKDLNIELGMKELVMPIYCTTYEVLVDYLKIKRREKPEDDNFEFEINFMSCFYIAAREGENDDIINIRPNIEAKLALKSDAQASSQYE